MEIDNYIIHQEVGRSALATVNLAEYEGRNVAIKVFRPFLSENPLFQEKFLELKDSFLALKHENYMPVYDMGICRKQCYWSMEYFPEGPLKHRLLVGIPMEQVQQVVQSVALVLDYLHNTGVAGFIHHGISPNSVFLREDGRVVLGEIELARIIAERHAIALPMNRFNAGHASPEQAMGQKPDKKTDFYQLGILLYELLTKQPLFHSLEKEPEEILQMHISSEIPELKGKVAYLQPFVDRLLAKDPNDRIYNTRQCLEASKIWQTEPEVLADGEEEAILTLRPQSSTIETAKPDAKKSGLGIMLSLVIGLSLIVAIAYWLSVSTESSANIEEQATNTMTEVDSAEKEIVYLLGLAQRQIDAKQYVEPINDNAYETYQKILLLDSDNVDAQQGLDNLANTFVDKAKLHLEQHQLTVALEDIEEGLSFFPESQALLELEDNIVHRLDAASRQHLQALQNERKLKQLTEQATKQMQQKQLALAYQSYQQMAQLEQGKTLAEQGQAKVVNAYQQMIDKALKDKQLNKAFQTLEQALKTIPNHPRLLVLQEKVKQQQQQWQRQRQQKIQKLMAQSQQYMQQQQLKSAYQSLQRVLELQANHLPAQARLNQIANLYLETATQAQSTGQLQIALTQIQEGLKLFPQHQGLKRFKTSIENQIKLEQRRLAQQRQLEQQAKRQQQQLQQQRQIAQTVQRLSQQIEQKLADQQWQQSYQIYQQLQQMAPNHPKTNILLERIEQQPVHLAREKQQQGFLNQALVLTKQGLEIFPRNINLQRLRQELTQQISVSIRKKQQEREQRERERQRQLQLQQQQSAPQPKEKEEEQQDFRIFGTF